MAEKSLGERLADIQIPYDIMDYIVTATLSSYPNGTRFITREGGFLIDRLTKLFLKSKNPLVIKNLYVDNRVDEAFNEGYEPVYLYNKNRVRIEIGPGTTLGKEIGFINLGLDMDYEFSQWEKYKRNRLKHLRDAYDFLGEETFSYFAELGKDLPRTRE